MKENDYETVTTEVNPGRKMEDERNGYLTYMEGQEHVGTLSFTMDGIVLDCEVPEINGTYWY